MDFSVSRKSDVYDIFLTLLKIMFPLNSNVMSKMFKVTMVGNLIMVLFGNFVKIMACHSVFLVLIPLLKMGKPKENFVL